LPHWLAHRHAIQQQISERTAANLATLDLLLAEQTMITRLEVEAGWYAVLRIPAIRCDEETAIQLIRESRVSTHPGYFFGFSGNGWLVVSLLTPKIDFKTGLMAIIRTYLMEEQISMPNNAVPYPSYHYLVRLEGTILGGFSEMSKIQGIHTVSDVTLKRGVIDSTGLWNWINSIKISAANAKKQVTITQRNEANQPAEVYKLSQATPKKYTGPTLSGKGSGDVAIEKLILACENISIEIPPS
jgi:phage tail-like protein